MSRPPLTLLDVLSKITLRDTALVSALAGLGYHAYVARSTLKALIEELTEPGGASPGGGTEVDIPFGFCAPEIDMSHEDEWP
jgi:hypothetical protein